MKAALVHNLITVLHLDLLVITETLMTSDALDAIKLPSHSPSEVIKLRQTWRRCRHCSQRCHSDPRCRRQLVAGVQDAGCDAQLSVTASDHVTCIYRPSASVTHEFYDTLSDLLDQLMLMGSRFVIFGDFKLPSVAAGHLNSQLAYVLQQYSLNQLVHHATNEGSNTLPLVVVPDDD
jgi:hypothetical protein